MNKENNLVKEYYENEYNKDGHGVPFDQLTRKELIEIQLSSYFLSFLKLRLFMINAGEATFEILKGENKSTK